MKPISFILPSRNNLKYLRQAYDSIRSNSLHPHEICIADDASTDGTKEWVQGVMEEDKNGTTALQIKGIQMVHESKCPDLSDIKSFEDDIVKGFYFKPYEDHRL